jgi:Domain of unknown function (DUF4352)
MALSTATTPNQRTTAGRPDPAASRRGSALALVAVFVVVLVALAGASMAAGILRHRDTAGTAPLADPATPDLSLGQAVRTSFGSVTATEALINNGLSSEDLGGMSHGVSNLVSTGNSEVNVVVRLQNTGKRPVGIDATQFRLLVGAKGSPAGKPLKATVTTLQAGGLAPGATLDARVTFVSPSDGSQLWLQFTDPHGTAAPIRIELGRTSDVKAAPAASGHQH